MKTACCTTDTLLCDTGGLERPRYFPRQLVSDTELTLDQQYFRDKLRRHNRLLHGWGVVCGALVCPYIPCEGARIEPWKVVVQRGYVLGPYGDEILIDCAKVIDLRTPGTTGISGGGGGEVSDPWCAESYVHCEEGGDFYIAVKYLECPTRPVRVQPGGCGCDETACEYSRWRDGYEIGVLRECPTPSVPPYPRVDWLTAHGPCGHVPECPPCPTEPWVGLAHVTVDACGMVTINNCECRRMVASFSTYWWPCQAKTYATDPIKFDTLVPIECDDKKVWTLSLRAPGLGPHSRITCDDPVTTVERWTYTPPALGKADGQLDVWVRVPRMGRGGDRRVTFRIVNKDCTVVVGWIDVRCPPADSCPPEPGGDPTGGSKGRSGRQANPQGTS